MLALSKRSESNVEVRVSAPGKIFLMGEHAVVYGKPALLTSVDKRVTVTIKNSKKNSIKSLDDDFIRQIIDLIKNQYHIKSLPVTDISIVSTIKNGYHLGSSAAVSVATVAALLFFLKKIWNPELVNKLSYEVEKIKHGTPSGADNSTVTFGGFVWYRKELEFLKNIWQVPLKVSPLLNHFYLIDTGRPLESTKEMVFRVRQRFDKNKKNMNELFNLIEFETKNIAVALKNADKQSLINAVKSGQSVLEKIGVVSKYVIPFIREVEVSGGVVKILGGGGSSKGVGYLLCFQENFHKLSAISDKYGFPLEKVELGQDGLRLEKDK